MSTETGMLCAAARWIWICTGFSLALLFFRSRRQRKQDELKVADHVSNMDPQRQARHPTEPPTPSLRSKKLFLQEQVLGRTRSDPRASSSHAFTPTTRHSCRIVFSCSCACLRLSYTMRPVPPNETSMPEIPVTRQRLGSCAGCKDAPFLLKAINESLT